MSTTHPIVIVGGGYAGLKAAFTLDRLLGARVDTPIFLIDASPNHMVIDGTYAIASQINPHLGLIPFDSLVQGTDIRFIRERVTSFDLKERQVITERHRFSYGDLILAYGLD